MGFGFDSLFPPLIAILLAIATRRVVIPLAFGVFCGAIMLAPGDSLIVDPAYYFYFSLKTSILDSSHLQALLFTLLLGAMVGVLESGGAMKDLVTRIGKRIRSRRGAQTMIATTGLAVFFDDYANSLLVGGTMRSTADRFGLSRSKLAYLVDSTAAPVAGLAIISTWVATEISYMTDGLRDAGITDPAAGFELFIGSIPYRFYPLLAIVMVFIIAWTGRDFGPMAKEESEVNRGAADDEESKADDEETTASNSLWLAAVVPVLLCVVTVGFMLLVTGFLSYGPRNGDLSTAKYLGFVIGRGDSYQALISGGAIGWGSTCLMHLFFRGCGVREILMGTYRGGCQIMTAMVILWLAWALSWMTNAERLDTSGYLASVLTEGLRPEMLPAAVFVIAGFMAFSTGTSWGTMGILTPLSVSLAMAMDPEGGPGGAICLATSGSVLAGAIFGDHCSPISDTTVLSSRASGCDHLAHVRTQMPYALVVGVVSIFAGCIPAAFGLSPWICLVFSVAALILVVKRYGRLPSEA